MSLLLQTIYDYQFLGVDLACRFSYFVVETKFTFVVYHLFLTVSISTLHYEQGVIRFCRKPKGLFVSLREEFQSIC